MNQCLVSDEVHTVAKALQQIAAWSPPIWSPVLKLTVVYKGEQKPDLCIVMVLPPASITDYVKVHITLAETFVRRK